MKTPNQEQKLAIEHSGGVLLSAGAGSGKTFVLVEHLLYLLQVFFDKQAQEIKNNDDLLLRQIRSYLAGLVFMTFTKKAAGELLLRMKGRVQLQIDSAPHSRFWILVQEALPSLTVSTIHGFCFKLLGGGYFPELEPNPVIISEIESAQRLNTLMREWFESEKKKGREFIDILLANSDSILEALKSIFNSCELRSAWKIFDSTHLNKWDKFWSELIDLSNWTELFTPSFSLESVNGLLNDKQKEYLKNFQNLCLHSPINDAKNIEAYLTFAKIRSPQFRKKEELGSLADYLETLKDFRDFLKNNEDDLLAFLANKDKVFSLWPKLLKDLFDYCEEHYRRYPGFTFSDLEYYVLCGLQRSETRLRVGKDYRYFVIDEFQDTSPGQYEIVQLILENDLRRLFVVGDIKQAIYGFRGGELGVFKQCQKEIPHLLSLKNNYRSSSSVIHFNNELFTDILARGQDFEGRDGLSVFVEKQVVPMNLSIDEGIVCKIKTDLEIKDPPSKVKIKSSELAQIEASVLFNKIKNIKKNNPDDNICILYKKLAPAGNLVSLLLKEDLSFSAQMKVPLSEDPLLSVFILLMENLLNKKDKEAFLLAFDGLQLMIQSHFDLMGFGLRSTWKDDLARFYDDINLFGIATSYRKLLATMGLSNSNFENNLALVDILCQVAKESVESIVTLLRESEKSYSLDFKNGGNCQKILIMTVHASKGLEFDHVLLAGIHANHRTQHDDAYVGKFPGSFKWKGDVTQKTPYKSLEFILEKLVTVRKNFSESKRLFYVAATRAKKALYYADIFYDGSGLSAHKMDWINGLRKFEDETLFLKPDIHQIFLKNCEHISFSFEARDKNKVANSRPLFHYDNLGLTLPSLSCDLNFVISGELSVTRLATICDCPRKFYLKNICRFSDDELSLIGKSRQFQNNEKDILEESSLEEGPVSSMKRGSHLHQLISQMIKNEAIEKLSSHESKMLLWLKEQFPNKGEFYSEEALKFSLFGFMISGTPDLVITTQEEEFSVWDFKTGKRHLEKEKSYWFQVYCYGYALFEKYRQHRTDIVFKQMSFVLAYVDEEKIIVEQKNFNEIQDSIFPVIKKLVHLTQENLDHCPHCSFSILCRP